MAAHTFNVNIVGYWRDVNKSGIPHHSGVYFVYECTYDHITDKVTLPRLIYIGEAENVNERISNHEKYDEWLGYVRTGNELCFSTGQVTTNRERAEAAYIFKHNPPANTDCTRSFDYDLTTIISGGATALLDINFTLQRSPSPFRV